MAIRRPLSGPVVESVGRVKWTRGYELKIQKPAGEFTSAIPVCDGVKETVAANIIQ